MTDYIETNKNWKLVPDVPPLRDFKKIVKHIFVSNKVKIYDVEDENVKSPFRSTITLYEEVCDEYIKVAKKLISNGYDNANVQRNATIAAIVYLAVGSARIYFEKINNSSAPSNNKVKEDKLAFNAANKAILNEDFSNIYTIAYNAAYNAYITAPVSKKVTTIVENNKVSAAISNNKNDCNQLTSFSGTNSFKEAMVAFANKFNIVNYDATISKGLVRNIIRIKLKMQYKCIITGNNIFENFARKWLLENNKISITDFELMDLACNYIVNTAKNNGATVIGPIGFPDKKLIGKFYSNYHFDKKVRETNNNICYKNFGAHVSFILLTRYPSRHLSRKIRKRLTVLGISDGTTGADALAGGVKIKDQPRFMNIYVIEPTKKTLDFLKNLNECQFI